MNFQTLNNGRSTFDEHYGAAAYTLADQLGFIFYRAAGIEPTNWETRLYENGLVALAPVAGNLITQAAFDSVNIGEAHGRAFARALEGMTAHGCSGETLEKLRAAEGQIQDLISAV